MVSECADDAGREQFVGIAYRSRLGDEFANWAVFEPSVEDGRLDDQSSEPARADDPDFLDALELLHIRARLAPDRAAGRTLTTRPRRLAASIS